MTGEYRWAWLDYPQNAVQHTLPLAYTSSCISETVRNTRANYTIDESTQDSLSTLYMSHQLWGCCKQVQQKTWSRYLIYVKYKKKRNITLFTMRCRIGFKVNLFMCCIVSDTYHMVVQISILMLRIKVYVGIGKTDNGNNKGFDVFE